jgi:hypothetical protein
MFHDAFENVLRRIVHSLCCDAAGSSNFFLFDLSSKEKSRRAASLF